MSVAIASGCRIGWGVAHPLVWINERGEAISLLDRGPALVALDIREAVGRRRLQEVAREFQCCSDGQGGNRRVVV